MMDAKTNFYELHMKRFELFKEQDLENGDFDVVFDFNGTKLHANRLILSTVSTTFKSMLSERWSKPDESIAIKDYTYDDFKEFLIFIYSGECQLTESNIVAMVDMAEFYGVTVFKMECEKFLMKIWVNEDHIFQIMEIAYKYSMLKLKKSVHDFIFCNLYIFNDISNFLQSEKFQKLEKTVVKDLVELNQHSPNQEELFETVYKWAEKRATENQKSDQNLNEAIKDEFADILPLFKFEEMNYAFLLTFAVPKSFLFSGDELSNILLSKNKVHVNVTDKNGKSMKGKLVCDDIKTVETAVQSQKNKSCIEFDDQYFFWDTKIPKPSTPSKLTKDSKIIWYFVFDKDGDIAVKHRDLLHDDDYLLAELFAEDGFELSNRCKIEAFCRIEFLK